MKRINFTVAVVIFLSVVIVALYSCNKEESPAQEESGQYTDPRDGKIYEIVQIGDQIWFAKNMNYTTTNSWWYDNISSNGGKYGRLYRWDDACSACPDGWHLASDDEWQTLEIFLGMNQDEADSTGMRGEGIATKLKSKTDWHQNGNGTDEAGFTALPGGTGDTYGFSGIGEGAYFWTSSSYSDNQAYYRTLRFDYSKVWRNVSSKDIGRSVRCIKD
jgi:uncharacterized protein (TIGR02145 family)